MTERPGDDLTTDEKWCYCQLVEEGAHPIEAAVAMLVPWETVKRSLGVDPFFANRWAKAVRRGEHIEREPELVLELKAANPELLRRVLALIEEADAGNGSGSCSGCGASLRLSRPGDERSGDEHRDGCEGVRKPGEVVPIRPPVPS